MLRSVRPAAQWLACVGGGAGACVLLPWHPPGCVPPLQACVKLAYDTYNYVHMPAYAQQAHEIGAKLMGASNSLDYMAVASVAAEVLLKCQDNRKRF